jgi:uncharacterized membrane protein YhaH (DUF805 family)
MADVFISYAREDGARAEQIARALGQMGLDVFWDTEIPPGKTWADYIEEKLANAKAMIVLWSANSTGSQWVREEARMGRDSGKLIPAMLDGTPAPFGFGEVQSANLSNWNGAANHPDFVRFANAVDGKVRGPGASPRPIPQPAASSFASAPTASVDASGSLSPVGYIARCFQKYFNGNGRARRMEFGWFMLFQFVAFILALMIDGSMFGFNAYTSQPNMYLATWALLALIPPAVSVTSRRAHDLGWTGWLALVAVIPYVGWVVNLILLFAPGNAGDNKYGPSPKAA